MKQMFSRRGYEHTTQSISGGRGESRTYNPKPNKNILKFLHELWLLLLYKIGSDTSHIFFH